MRVLLPCLLAPVIILAMTACAPAAHPGPPTPGGQAAVTSIPATSSLLPPAVQVPTEPTQAAAALPALSPPETQSLPGGLVLEVYPLVGQPTLDPLTFRPVVGTQKSVLARRAAERQDEYHLDLRSDDQYRPALTAEFEGGTLLARIETDAATQAQTAELWQGDRLIFSAPAGFPSPASTLQGLWTYDSHWSLELLMATPDLWVGQVYVDGQLLNDQLGYDEAFGFQLMGGKPFYFYERDGTIGVSYAGQDADLGYSQIPHYECCSGSVLNPVPAHTMVAFFAELDGEWRYVEIGLFGAS